MKKNFKYNKLIMIIIFLIISIVFFLVLKETYSITESNQRSQIVGKIKIECDRTSILPNESLNCAIKGENFTTQLSSYSAKLILGNNLSLVAIEKDSSWEGSGDGGIIDLYTDVNKTGNFNIATFTVKADDINAGIDSNILLQNITISDENFDEYVLNNATLDLRIKSTINTLSSLTISGINFDFNKDITTYNLTTELGNITLNAIATNSSASISGDIGVKNLNYGENTFKIIVTSESGSEKVYTLIINRPEKLSFTEDVKVDEEKLYLNFKTPGLNINNIRNKIDTTGNLIITDKKGNPITETDNIGTGYKINIELSNKKYTYTAIILGDTTGDGKITVTDVSKMFQHYRNTNTMEDIYIVAGDVKNDNEIKLTDVAKLFQYVRGKIDNLEE